MICFEFENNILMPVRKICNVLKHSDNPLVLDIWLDGGQIQRIAFKATKDREKCYNKLKALIKTL